MLLTRYCCTRNEDDQYHVRQSVPHCGALCSPASCHYCISNLAVQCTLNCKLGDRRHRCRLIGWRKRVCRAYLRDRGVATGGRGTDEGTDTDSRLRFPSIITS